MSPTVQACLAWLRRHLPGSTSPRDWAERGVLLGLAATGYAVYRVADQPAPWVLATFLLLGVFLLAYLLRRGGLRFFGPVLFYDLVRLARRRRFFLTRVGYVTLLFGFLLWVYALQFERGGSRRNAQADLADQFFLTFNYLQFVLVALLTPAYTAGAIAEEKERRTLEFLFATDLANREIVFGKLVSRLATLALVVLAGLPVLSILQFMGGISPDMMLASFAATGMTMLSLASLGILSSVLVRRARDAILLTYLVGVSYFALSFLSLIVSNWPGFASAPLWWGPEAWVVQDLVNAFNAGNVFLSLLRIQETLQSGATLDLVLPDLLRGYATFHGTVALGCVTLAVLRLRAVAKTEGAVKAGRGKRSKSRAPVGNAPVAWKELHVERGPRFHIAGRVLLAFLVALSFLPAVLVLYFVVLDDSPWRPRGETWRQLGEAMNFSMIRPVGTVVACLLLLGVAVRAAGAIRGEHDRQTLDALLGSPLELSDILWGKWLGAVFGLRLGFAWLLLIWAVGIVTGGLNPLALGLLVGAWFVYAGFLAVLGLWFSVTCSTTLRATVWTLTAAVGLGAGHWLLWMCCMPCLVGGGGGGGEAIARIAEFQLFALTPPAALALFAFRGDDFTHGMTGELLGMLGCGIVGLFLWVIGAVFLWGATRQRFVETAGRGPFPRPRTSSRASSIRPE